MGGNEERGGWVKKRGRELAFQLKLATRPLPARTLASPRWAKVSLNNVLCTAHSLHPSSLHSRLVLDFNTFVCRFFSHSTVSLCSLFILFTSACGKQQNKMSLRLFCDVTKRGKKSFQDGIQWTHLSYYWMSDSSSGKLSNVTVVTSSTFSKEIFWFQLDFFFPNRGNTARLARNFGTTIKFLTKIGEGRDCFA